MHLYVLYFLKNPETTWIDTEVKIGQDTILLPNTILEGNTNIGEDLRQYKNLFEW
mgnify:CR=1 FL=1